MRKTFAPAMMVAALALWGCSRAEPEREGNGPSSGQDMKTTVAYGFTYRFGLPSAAVDQAQDRHIAACDRMGPARCRMQEMHRSAGDSSTSASTRLVVAAGEARRFGQDLLAPVAQLGGTLRSRDFEAEDLAKQRGDAQAKVAEKDTAANRGALAGVQERLETSSIWIYYTGSTSFGGQIGGALSAVGETLTTSIVMLIYFLAGALPWALALTVIVLLVRAAMGMARRRFPKSRGPAPFPSDPHP